MRNHPVRVEGRLDTPLSRGLWLVKWLLALPHYLVVALFVSGGVLVGDRYAPSWQFDFGGLIGLLVLIAAVALLFTGRYPRGIFDVVLGMNRWALRVAAYAALMTDAYPPFRFDAGEREPATEGAPPVESPHAPANRWTGGAITAVLSGSVLALAAIGTLFAGIGAATLNAARGPDGFVSVNAGRLTTDAYAITSDDVTLTAQGVRFLHDSLGRVRVIAHGDEPLFIGVAPSSAADAYLADVAHDQVRRLDRSAGPHYSRSAGTRAPAAPLGQAFWTAESDGATLVWNAEPGQWTVVLMNADGSPGVSADVEAGAIVPALGGIVTGLLTLAAILAMSGTGLIVLGLYLAAPTRTPARPSVTTGS
ncbi:DUF4389 domain-containing protein [Microbispora sp. NPDC049125]|uniref:DUF4389 domain-containing protein n=1 Tax=Microbispora sp. NPDC049125 TaxID=3154929 RepID=UPI003467CA3A